MSAPVARAVLMLHRVPRRPSAGPPVHSPRLPARFVVDRAVALTDESVTVPLNQVAKAGAARSRRTVVARYAAAAGITEAERANARALIMRAPCSASRSFASRAGSSDSIRLTVGAATAMVEALLERSGEQEDAEDE